jgi:hypothetical protein
MMVKWYASSGAIVEKKRAKIGDCGVGRVVDEDQLDKERK